MILGDFVGRQKRRFAHMAKPSQIKKHSVSDIKINAKPPKSYGLGLSPHPPHRRSSLFLSVQCAAIPAREEKRRGGKRNGEKEEEEKKKRRKTKWNLDLGILGEWHCNSYVLT